MLLEASVGHDQSELPVQQEQAEGQVVDYLLVQLAIRPGLSCRFAHATC